MIDRRSYVPPFRQLAELLRAQIADGTFPPGALLPAESRLASEHGLARDTVRAALTDLRREGLIETTHRGPRVKVPPTREIYSVQRSSRVITRMPTPAERAEHDLGDGVPVFEIRYGARVIILPGDRTELLFK